MSKRLKNERHYDGRYGFFVSIKYSNYKNNEGDADNQGVSDE